MKLITLRRITFESPEIPIAPLPRMTVFSILQRVTLSPIPLLSMIELSLTRQLVAVCTPEPLSASRISSSLRSETAEARIAAFPKFVMVPPRSVMPAAGETTSTPPVDDPAPSIVKPFRSRSTFDAVMVSASEDGEVRFPVST